MRHMKDNNTTNDWFIVRLTVGQWTKNKHAEPKNPTNKPKQTKEKSLKCIYWSPVCLEQEESQLWMNRAEAFDDFHIHYETYTKDHWALLCSMDNTRQTDHSISIWSLLQVMEAQRWERSHESYMLLLYCFSLLSSGSHKFSIKFSL